MDDTTQPIGPPPPAPRLPVTHRPPGRRATRRPRRWPPVCCAWCWSGPAGSSCSWSGWPGTRCCTRATPGWPPRRACSRSPTLATCSPGSGSPWSRSAWPAPWPSWSWNPGVSGPAPPRPGWAWPGPRSPWRWSRAGPACGRLGAGGHDHDPAAAHDPAAHVHEGATATAAGTTGDADGPEMAEHTHGPNVPEVAAATDDERAKAEALWKASVANAGQWRDPDAATAAGFRFRDRTRRARSGASGSSTCPTRPGGPTGACSTRPVRRRSSTGTGRATA